MLGLIELLLVVAIALGWAVFELRGVSKSRSPPSSPSDPPRPDPPPQ